MLRPSKFACCALRLHLLVVSWLLLYITLTYTSGWLHEMCEIRQSIATTTLSFYLSMCRECSSTHWNLLPSGLRYPHEVHSPLFCSGFFMYAQACVVCMHVCLMKNVPGAAPVSKPGQMLLPFPGWIPSTAWATQHVPSELSVPILGCRIFEAKPHLDPSNT